MLCVQIKYFYVTDIKNDFVMFIIYYPMLIYVDLFLMCHMICDFVMIIKIKLIDLIFCFILLFDYNLLSYDL